MLPKPRLSVSIHDVEFAKDYQYFISIGFNNEKKSTDVSAIARSPIFTNNTLIFSLPSLHTLKGNLFFFASMIPQDAGDSRGSSKILGECSLDLTPFGLQPSEVYNLPIRQQLNFVRNTNGREISVGRFIASLKIVQEDNLPVYLQELETKKMENHDVYNDLPEYDPSMEFDWRVKVEIREAVNIPAVQNVNPQVFVEVGWTEYQDVMPEQKRIFTSNILNNRHPEWHQTFLVYNPPHVKELKGFIKLTMRDKHNLEDLFQIKLPVESMGLFVPYNIVATRAEEGGKMEFYFSVVLEAPLNKKDRLLDIVVSDITIEPAIAPFKTIHLAAVVQSSNEPSLRFKEFSSKDDTIERILQFDQAEEFTYFLSQNMRLPPVKSSKYRAATILTISESLLKKNISFYIVGRLSKATYQVAGQADSVQRDLICLLIDKSKKQLFLPVRPHPSVKMGACQIEITAQEKVASSQALSQSEARQRGQETASERLMRELQGLSGDSMLRHVTQNNQIIGRILKELDDKSESLKQAAVEISNLRGRVKLLQNENSILRQNAVRQEDELVGMVQREVENMGVRDLKQKIVKLAQLYKSERNRCKELDRTIQVMEPQVANAMQLNSIILSHKNTIQTLSEKIQKMTKDNERIAIYKDTIKKQEKVIVKLEQVLKQGAEDVRRARKAKIEQEQTKRKGDGSHVRHNMGQQEQIERLQRIIAQMQEQGKFAGKSGASSRSEFNSPFELQFKLHQAETRIASLEEQLQEKGKSYARELATFKMRIAEKEAMIDGYMR